MKIERSKDTIVYKMKLSDLIENDLVIDDFISKNNFALDFIFNLIKREKLEEKVNKMHCLVDKTVEFPITLTIGFDNSIVPFSDIKEEEDKDKGRVEDVLTMVKSKKGNDTKERLVINNIYIINNIDILINVIERGNMDKDVCLYKIKDNYYLDIQENKKIKNIDSVFNEFNIDSIQCSPSYLKEHCDKKQVIKIKDLQRVIS